MLRFGKRRRERAEVEECLQRIREVLLPVWVDLVDTMTDADVLKLAAQRLELFNKVHKMTKGLMHNVPTRVEQWKRAAELLDAVERTLGH